jgi:glycerol-3-phosphate dehydrogenase (NAD(P)+)
MKNATPRPDSVAVLGAGSWGTALATLVARNGFNVVLWDIDSEHLGRLAHARENTRYLPGIPLPDRIAIEPDFDLVATATPQLLLVVPSHGFRATMQRLRDAACHDDPLTVSWGTKGFDPDSGMLLSDVVGELLPDARRAVVSGPSFAKEVARGLPTALTAASDDPGTAEKVAGWLRNDRVRVYTNDDLAGVQLGGAIKNVMAVAAGISDGLGFGANARAALITRGLAEMQRLGVALGGQAHTFMGLTGLGDLVLTCTDDQSRNRRVGLGLGQGKRLQQITADIGQEAEGVKTAKELYALARRLGVEMPITEQVYGVLYEGRSPQVAVDKLFQRDPRPE